MKKGLLIFLFCLLIGGIFGILYVLPPEFDFLNFKLYNGWAFLNHRFGVDIMPTGFRSFFNPILDSATFYIYDKLNLHPYLFLFISGLKYGCFMFLSYLIFSFVITVEKFDRKFIIFTLMLLTAASPVVIYLTNFGYTDLQLAILVLLSFYLFFKTIYEEKNIKNSIVLIISGLFAGMSVGLKYTQGIFALAMLLSVIFFSRKIKQPIKTSILMLTGMISGFLITDGYWMYMLWKHFHNPFFPYFNSIFNSSLTSMDSIFTDDFSHLRPHNIFEFIFLPLKNTFAGSVGTEWNFFDIKIQLTFIALVIYFIATKFVDIKQNLEKFIKPDFFHMIIFITITAYYLNILLFTQLRYLTPLIPFTGLIIIGILHQLYVITDFKNTKLNAINITLFFVYIIYCQYNYLSFHHIVYEMIHIIILLYIIFIIVYSSKSESQNKNFYITISVLAIIALTSNHYFRIPINRNGYIKNYFVQDLKIEDGANVILDSNLTSFIAVKQNPKAKYIGFAIPNNYEKQGYYNRFTKYRNMYYVDKNQENVLKNVFDDDKNIYFIYSEHYSNDGFDVPMYNESIKYYSNNKIDGLKNCKSIKYYFFLNSNYDAIKICKLK